MGDWERRPVVSARTRFPELSYSETSKGLWRIQDADGAEIGPHYASKAELLADLDRYAADYFGTPNPRMAALLAQRDALREALRDVRKALDMYADGPATEREMLASRIVNAALASVDGAR